MMGTSDWFSEDFENVGSPRKSGHFTKSRSRFQRAKSGRPAEKESTAQSEPKKPDSGASPASERQERQGAALFLLQPRPLLQHRDSLHNSEDLYDECPALPIPAPAPKLTRIRMQGHRGGGPAGTMSFTLHAPPQNQQGNSAPSSTIASQQQPTTASTFPTQPALAPPCLLSTWKTAKMRRARACIRPWRADPAGAQQREGAGGSASAQGGAGNGVGGHEGHSQGGVVGSTWGAVLQGVNSAMHTVKELPHELAMSLTHAHPWLFERAGPLVSDSHRHHYHGADLPTGNSARLHTDLGVAWPALGLALPAGEQAVTNWLLLWSEHGTPPAQQPQQSQQPGSGQPRKQPQLAPAARPSGKPPAAGGGGSAAAATAAAGSADGAAASGKAASHVSSSQDTHSSNSSNGVSTAGSNSSGSGVNGVVSKGQLQRQGVVCVPLGVEQDASEDKQLWSIFREIDKDHNGVLDANELTQALSAMGLPCSQEYIQDMLKQYDKNRDGTISFSEFKAYIRQRNNDLEKAFKQFDKDGDGRISAQELENALRAANLPYVSHGPEVQRMLTLLARNESEGVSYADFRRFASLLPKTQLASGSHVLYAWANSSLWRQITPTPPTTPSYPPFPSQPTTQAPQSMSFQHSDSTTPVPFTHTATQTRDIQTHGGSSSSSTHQQYSASTSGRSAARHDSGGGVSGAKGVKDSVKESERGKGGGVSVSKQGKDSGKEGPGAVSERGTVADGTSATFTDPLLMAVGGHQAAIAAAATQISSPNEALLRLFIGGVAGVVSRTVIAPLERLRTIMMLSKTARSLPETAALMWADGGFLGLFKGHMSTVIKVFPTSAIQFGVVDATKKAFQAATNGGPVTELHCFVAGCLAGGVACIVSHPLDTIRTQMSAVVAGVPQRNMLQIARSLGLPGLYRGFGASCLMEVLGNGLGFLAVDKACVLFQQLHQGRTPNPQERGLLAAVSAMFVMTAVMPLDVVVRRIQVQGSPGHPVLYRNALDAFQTIARTEGLGAFYRGMLTTFMKTGPSMGAVYYFYDTFGKLSGVGGLNRYRTPLLT